MGITVLLPVVGAQEITLEAMYTLMRNAGKPDELDIIIVDNASKTPYNPMEFNPARVLRNEVNIAGYGALLQILPLAKNDIILWMHNDVLIHESDWDLRIQREFDNDPQLAIAGFFGGYGVAENGGRIGSMGNMQGAVWGTPQHMHGDVMTGTYPAVVFDSLAIIVRKSHFIAANLPHERIPPHHWNDRIVPLWLVDKGYHAIVIGIGFDHKGGVSSLGDEYRELAERWSTQRGLSVQKDWDYTFYSEGERFFREQWFGRFPVIVDQHFNVRWGS